MNVYTSLPWEALCDEVSKLKIDLPDEGTESLLKAVGSDLDLETLTTVLTTVPEADPAAA